MEEPAATPVTMPVLPTVALAGTALLQVPPGTASESDVVDPAHTVLTPDIVPATGAALTVTTVVAVALPQPLVSVYETVVVPPEIPLTRPDAFTVPVAGFEEVHTPPADASLSDVVPPMQTTSDPDKVPAFGSGFTVTIAVL